MGLIEGLIVFFLVAFCIAWTLVGFEVACWFIVGVIFIIILATLLLPLLGISTAFSQSKKKNAQIMRDHAEEYASNPNSPAADFWEEASYYNEE